MNFEVGYGITRRLHAAALPTVRESVTAALKHEGFGVLAEIDVQADAGEEARRQDGSIRDPRRVQPRARAQRR